MMKTFLLLFCLTLTMTLSASENQSYRVWFKLDESVGQNLVQIEAFARSRENVILDYQLSLKKSGRSGQSTIQQSGKKHFPKNQPVLLTTQLISLAADDRYTVTLTLLKQGSVVAEQTFAYPDQK